MGKLSQRLAEIVDALPLYPGIRVLEIGCGTGVAACAIASRIGNGYLLAIDRSAKAIQLAQKNAKEEIASGRLSFRQLAVEDFALAADEQLFDLAFAIRVGALDGRHPKAGARALPRIASALSQQGKLYIDGGNPLQEISLDFYRK